MIFDLQLHIQEFRVSEMSILLRPLVKHRCFLSKASERLGFKAMCVPFCSSCSLCLWFLSVLKGVHVQAAKLQDEQELLESRCKV